MYPKAGEDKTALGIWGLSLEDIPETVLAVWPDNRQAVVVFLGMRTQWRVGMNGPTGLDYAALPEIWRRTRTPPSERDEVFEQLRHLEVAALNEMHKPSD